MNEAEKNTPQDLGKAESEKSLPNKESIIIRPATHALVIRGWMYFIFSVAFDLGMIFIWACIIFFPYTRDSDVPKNLLITIFVFLLWIGGAYLGLSIITLRIEISDDRLIYSYPFGKRRVFRLSEIESVFPYKMQDNSLVLPTSNPITTKIMYAVVPLDLKEKIFEIDSSLFYPEDVSKLNAFWKEKLEEQNNDAMPHLFGPSEAIKKIRKLKRERKEKLNFITNN
jgi:hypothetical protein